MIHPAIAEILCQLQENDLELRTQLLQAGKLDEGYHPEMEAMHRRNATILKGVLDQIGYPSIDQVGEAANEAAWLVAQHAISMPDLMRQYAALLTEAVANQQANPLHLAYLTDRIAIYEGRPQLYGTSFDWNEQGILAPKPYDDLAKVNARRKALGLVPLEVQTERMNAQAQQENHSSPADWKARQEAYEAWRRRVGWVR